MIYTYITFNVTFNPISKDAWLDTHLNVAMGKLVYLKENWEYNYNHQSFDLI